MYVEPRHYSMEQPAQSPLSRALESMHLYWVSNCCSANLETLFAELEDQWEQHFRTPFLERGMKPTAPRLTAVHFEYHYRECNALLNVAKLRDDLEDLELIKQELLNKGMFIQQMVGGMSTGNDQLSAQMIQRYNAICDATTKKHKYLTDMWVTLQSMSGSPQLLAGMALKPLQTSRRELLHAHRTRQPKVKTKKLAGLFNQ
jgi:hypothetical protein